MSAAENKAVIQRLVEEANEGNLLWETWADDVVIHNDDFPRDDLNMQDLQRMLEELLVAFPDLHEKIETLIAEDDGVVGLYTETATMTQDFMGMEATGQRYSIPAVEIYRLADSKIVEAWFVRPYTSMFRQLGLA